MGPSAQCRVPLCKPILEFNSGESVDVKNGKTLKDWTRETRDSITQPLSEMMRRGDPYERNGEKFLASDFSETRRVASTDPLEVTYQISAS